MFGNKIIRILPRIFPLKPPSGGFFISAYQHFNATHCQTCATSCQQPKNNLLFSRLRIPSFRIIQTPVINANAELLSIAERLVSQLLEKEERQTTAAIVRRYMLQVIPGVNLSLKNTACNLNMSDRTLQRKLLSENTSYQSILDGVRKELAKKYLEENVSFVEISFLLGFESQSAFNKFFKKHFGKQPKQYRQG